MRAMSEHTRHPLAYLKEGRDDDQIGDNWLVATLDFGLDGRFFITTDHVHASELELGDPEADVRLWCGAAGLLAACQYVVSQCRSIDDPIARAIQRALEPAIRKATGNDLIGLTADKERP
jgi:hypothetical protein